MPLGSLVKGIFDTTNGILNNYYNRKAQSRQNAVQWEMWNANNDYNSPASVMQRLEEAGLNPNLVYDNGGASYQATMPTAAKRAPSDFHIDPGLNALTFQQLENMEAQNDLTRQQDKNAQTQNRILDANARIAEKDAEIYESTGVRPGDSPIKSIWRAISNWFSFDDSSRFGHAVNETKKKVYEVNSDKRPHSKNNSSNVKFYD